MKLKTLSSLPLLTTLTTLASSSVLAADPIGTFENPSALVTNTSDIGSVLFTNIVTFLTVISGLWAFIQFIMGDLGYITGGGDPKKVTEAQSKIINSLIGMVIIGASFILAGIIGALLFKNPSFILSPSFQTIN